MVLEGGGGEGAEIRNPKNICNSFQFPSCVWSKIAGLNLVNVYSLVCLCFANVLCLAQTWGKP